MKSLRKNIPDKPPWQAEAIDGGLCAAVISFILNSEPTLFLGQRYACNQTAGFLKGLRASDMAVIDYLRSVEWLATADGETYFTWRVWGGKTTREQAEVFRFSNEGISFDVVGIFGNYRI